MTEINNEVLAVLVIAAMAISLAGTFTTLTLVTEPEMITGFAAHTGLTNVSIPRYGDITLNVALVNFNDIATGQSNSTSDYDPHPFVLENNGSTFVNVTVGADALWVYGGFPATTYQVNASDDNETGTLSGTDGYAASFFNMPASGGNLIQCMNYSDTTDAMNVHISITVPGGETSGYKESTVTFTGSDALQGNCGE
ncbi:MAG: hypothetical protein JXC85_02640 [Candidatus Aenigmarchaeota archaeon]|nr:hypothetical protein [Candidatus Aenigmarchaeota archaeon]